MTSPETHTQNNDIPRIDIDEESDRYDIIRWRREQVLALRAKGMTIDAIVDKLKAGHPDVKISHGTVVNDLKAIKEEVNRNLSQRIEQDLPMENRLALAGIQEIIKEAWKLAESTVDERVRISALQLAKEAYLTQSALLGDSKVLEQAVNWVKRAKKRLQEQDEDSETIVAVGAEK